MKLSSVLILYRLEYKEPNNFHIVPNSKVCVFLFLKYSVYLKSVHLEEV